MKKRIKSICLGILIICSLCCPNMVSNATQIASAESAVVDIETYEVMEGSLNPGEQITLKLRLKNNSDVSDARNTIVTFESASGALVPVYGDDNQIYIGTILAGQTIDVVVDAVVNTQYKADTAQLKCNFVYVSGVVALSNTVAINIPTNISGNLIKESVIVAEKATVGVNSLVSVRCRNEGNTTITDAKLVVEGKVKEENKEIQLPTIAAGKTLTEDYFVNFTENGIQNLQIALEYTDFKGNQCVIDCGEYKVNVTSNVAGTEYDAVIEQVEGTSAALLKIILLGAAVLMVIGVTLGYFRNGH